MKTRWVWWPVWFFVGVELFKLAIAAHVPVPIAYFFRGLPILAMTYCNGMWAGIAAAATILVGEFFVFQHPSGLVAGSRGFWVIMTITISQEAIAITLFTMWRNHALRLKSATRYRELAAGSLSHDLRTPLTVMAMSVHTLKAGKPASSETLRRLEAGCRRMANIIDQVMDMVLIHLNSGIRLVPKRCDMLVIARQAIEETAIVFPKAIVNLVTHEQEVVGNWDQTRVVRALVNLLSNACKYGDATQPIELKVSAYDHQVAVSVHNWGKPIPKEMMPYLFNPFTRGTQGYGLGLYITAEMIDKHGGSIDVSSNADIGTTFTTTLPRG
jgi:signal transduction histidine kinase